MSEPNFEFPSGALQALTQTPFGEASPLQWQAQFDAGLLKNSPFFQLMLLLLNEIGEHGHLSLTKRGYLPPRICMRLYDARLFSDWNVDEWLKGNVSKEKDWFHLHLLHTVLRTGRLVRKKDNRLSLTRHGEQMLGNLPALFRELVEMYALRFNWAWGDGYPPQIAQAGFGYGLCLLLRHGGQPKAPAFYGKKYVETFPGFLKLVESDWTLPEEQVIHCFEWRFFHRFTELFGLTSSQEESGFLERLAWVQGTPLLEGAFRMEAFEGR